MAGESGLPDFISPPVDETALSLQFPKIAGFGVPHFGLFWERIRSDYPRFEVQPPIPAAAFSAASRVSIGGRSAGGRNFPTA